MGTIKLFAGDFAPQDWAFCHGQTLRIQEESGLFTILGNRYGGDGTTTFQLPNLEPLQGVNYIICVYGLYPSHG